MVPLGSVMMEVSKLLDPAFYSNTIKKKRKATEHNKFSKSRSDPDNRRSPYIPFPQGEAIR